MNPAASRWPLGIIRRSELCRLFRARNKRHSFATHLLEQKTDIRVGHKKLDTTALYTRVAVSALRPPARPARPGRRRTAGARLGRRRPAFPLPGSVPQVFAVWPAAVARDVAGTCPCIASRE